MPKQFKTYTRFDGGLNTKTNARSIQDNELAQANNVIVDEFGSVKSSGKATDNDTNYQDPSVTATQAGYGLFQARLDEASGYSSGVNTSVITTFFAEADDGSVKVDSADNNGSYGQRVNLGAVTGDNQGKVIYHIADGTVRMCDTNINNTSTAVRKYGYFQTTDRFRNESGTTLTPGNYNGANGYQDLDTKLSRPTRGVCSIGMRGTTAAGGSDTLLISSVTDSFPSSVSTELSSGVYLAVNVTDAAAGSAGVDAIASRSTDERLVTAGSGGSFSDAGDTYAIYPPDVAGFNLDFDLTSSGGNWVAGTYEFATTFLYEGNQESLPFLLGGELTVSANDSITCTVMVTNNHGGTTIEANLMGGRIYFRQKGTDEAFVFFGEVSFINGTKPTIDGEFTHWTLEYGSVAPFARSSFVSTSINLDTYASLNGFGQDSSFISIGRNGEKYQTSVVSNRRAFIGNVKYFDEEGILLNRGDTIRYSEINKFDTFPELNFLDIGVNDGEEFVKLEAFADRILAYKENTLYIINVGGGSDTQWFLESSNKNMGVAFHGAVVKTEFGVAWVNKNGLYFYDGSRITNLQNKIIESDWTGFVNDDTMIGYEPTHKHLVVIRDAAASGSTSGDAYVYSFITKSFTFVEDLVTDGVKTNIITDLHNNMTLGLGTNEIVSYDGEPDAGTTFDIKLKDDDFGLPNIVKKIYGVTVEYASDNDNTNGVKYFFTNDSGVKQAVANAGTLSDTNNDLDVNRVTFGTPLLASSFQVQLDLDGDSIQKVNNVAVEYRPIYKRVT